MESAIKGFEYNFDGLVGPTHNFAGLSFGNTASEQSKFSVSNPKEAALQGLRKMKLLHDLGIPQGIIPVHERPDLDFLRSLGYSGKDDEVLEQASKKDLKHLLMSYSASSMWAANAATVSPSFDTHDRRLHITTANLFTHKHRALEAAQTARFLKIIFPPDAGFVHHPSLPLDETLSDEGAANHMRICEKHALRGVEIFVYGKQEGKADCLPKKYPARQSFAASKVIALSHCLGFEDIIFVQQNPQAIDSGVFHNDVIAVSNENVFLCHEEAFMNQDFFIQMLQDRFKKCSEKKLFLIEVSKNDMSLEEAVKCYFFNSQVVTKPDGTMAFLAPMECRQGKPYQLIHHIIQSDNPIKEVHFINLNESMRNGGGPACLRLRVVLSEGERHRINQECVFREDLYRKLENWINYHYRERLTIDDLKDKEFLRSTRQALDELTMILNLGPVYSFQK